MSITNYYVDPGAGNDSTGTGAVGAPWQTTQHALNTIAQGAGGDQINIKAGTDDTLSATLSLTTYGTPSTTKPLIVRGYTSAANDGGIGGLNGGGSFAILNEATKAPIICKDMHLHNCGSAVIWTANGSQSDVLEHCELDTTTGSGAVLASGNVSNCYAHDIGGTYMIDCSVGSVRFCRLECLTKTPTNGIRAGVACEFNTLALTGAAVGILTGSTGAVIHDNSIWSNAGTGIGISVAANSCQCFDNIVEGFSGAGGIGIKIGTNDIVLLYGNNKLFNNTTNLTNGGLIAVTAIADTANTASSFNNPSGAPADLSLNNTAGGGAVSRGSNYPGAYYGAPFTSYRDSGAIDHADPVAAGLLIAARRNLPPRREVIRSTRTLMVAGQNVTTTLLLPTRGRPRPYPVYLPRPQQRVVYLAGQNTITNTLIPTRGRPRPYPVVIPQRRNAANSLFASQTLNVTQTVLVASRRVMR